MAEKAQFMALVPMPVLRRLDALRIALGISRAEVNRHTLDQYLTLVERANVDRLGRLYAVAAAAGHKSWDSFVKELTEKYVRAEMPSLEELEITYGVREAPAPIATVVNSK